MIKAWGWKARPLQQGRSDAQGMSWTVGAAEGPPGPVMKTLPCSCENVPAIFQFFVNGNRLSQEPACRFQTILKPNLMSGRERFASSKDVEIQTSRFFSDLVSILFLSGLIMKCFCT